MRTYAGLREVATYADGIGPHLSHVVAVDAEGQPRFTRLVDDAHALRLFVHPYTFRADAIPAGVASFDELLELFVGKAKVDGLFTDHADRALQWLRASFHR